MNLMIDVKIVETIFNHSKDITMNTAALIYTHLVALLFGISLGAYLLDYLNNKKK